MKNVGEATFSLPLFFAFLFSLSQPMIFKNMMERGVKRGREKFEDRRLPKFGKCKALEYFGRVGDPLLPPTTLFSFHAGEAKTETQLYTTLISIYYESEGQRCS